MTESGAANRKTAKKIESAITDDSSAKMELDITTYAKMKTWPEKFPDKKVSLRNKTPKSWDKIFDKLFKDEKFDDIERDLSKELENAAKIYPLPDLVFNAFNLTSFKKLKVVFIGQDPYFSSEEFKSKQVPQAMGLSFSVPHGIKVPSSLKNIYSNLKKYKHMEEVPDHGNLESWADQGCLMLNSSLTVKDGTDSKNCHQYLWRWFTNEIISYISEKKDQVIFVLWGRDAFAKSNLIDVKKHELIVSSHPSGLSANKPMGNYPAFNAIDHFGLINAQLKKWGIKEICWGNDV